MFVTLDGYRVGWPTGQNRLSILSLGTGTDDASFRSQLLVASKAVGALKSLMDDSATLQETLLQWISVSANARRIDREIGDLNNDLLTREPVLTYNRFDLDLTEKGVLALDPGFNNSQIDELTALDAPENMTPLYELAEKLADQRINDGVFPIAFDLS